MHENNIQRVENTNFQGVYIDSKFKFSDQADAIFYSFLTKNVN